VDVLADVVGCLECPVCGSDLALDAAALRCARGHVFDVARQGYVNLLPGRARTSTADTPAMVDARAAFLDAGHFDAILDAVAAVSAVALGDGPAGCVADVGAGTGHYLARVLEQALDRFGLALDLSKHALRRAARAHPRIGAAVCDTWRPLPVRTDAAAVVLDVFAPRNAPEFARVLHPGGALVVVTPAADHLRELVDALGLVTVDERKDERLAASLGAGFVLAESVPVRFAMSLTRADVAAVVGMGPSSRHVTDAEMSERIAALPEPVAVTAAVTVAVYRARRGDGA
jgi:23S rRNA (guanine745-N1)-methyltransferase